MRRCDDKPEVRTLAQPYGNYGCLNRSLRVPAPDQSSEGGYPAVAPNGERSVTLGKQLANRAADNRPGLAAAAEADVYGFEPGLGCQLQWSGVSSESGW